jgi:hypothetical protein
MLSLKIKKQALLKILNYYKNSKKRLITNTRQTNNNKKLIKKDKMILVKQLPARKKISFIEYKIQSKFLRLLQLQVAGGSGKKAIQLQLM